jgi:hypothetical protein
LFLPTPPPPPPPPPPPFTPVFLKRWSAAVSEENAFQKLYQIPTERNIRPYMSVLKVPSLVDLQKKVGELVLSTTTCPSTIILEIKLVYRKM